MSDETVKPESEYERERREAREQNRIRRERDDEHWRRLTLEHEARARYDVAVMAEFASTQAHREAARANDEQMLAVMERIASALESIEQAGVSGR